MVELLNQRIDDPIADLVESMRDLVVPSLDGRARATRDIEGQWHDQALGLDGLRLLPQSNCDGWVALGNELLPQIAPANRTVGQVVGVTLPD